MTDARYACSDDLLNDRIRWTRAAMATLIAAGRTAGWIDGDAATPHGDDAAVLARSIAARIATSSCDVPTMPLEWAAARLGLSSNELDALWLLVCCELDPGLSRLVQVVTGGGEVSVQAWRLLARAAGVPLPESAMEILQRLVLIELTSDPRVSQQRRPVRASDRVLELARGEARLDPELAPFCRFMSAARGPAAPADLVGAFRSRPAPIIVATGPTSAGRSTCLRAVAGHHDLAVLRVDCRTLGRDTETVVRRLRAVARDACLFEAVPLLEETDDATHVVDAIEIALSHFAGPILMTAHAAPLLRTRPVVAHAIAIPTTDARAALWRDALVSANEEVIARAAEMTLRPGTIVAAARNARSLGGEHPVELEEVRAGLRAAMGEQLRSIAMRVDVSQTWQDLVLPADQFEQLVELVSRVRHRRTVLETWGFGDKVGNAKGIAALFSGPPGTGKTMAAGLVAKGLGRPLPDRSLEGHVETRTRESVAHAHPVTRAGDHGHRSEPALARVRDERRIHQERRAARRVPRGG